MVHLQRDCLKQKNEKGKGIRVESFNDIAASAYGISNGNGYDLSIIEYLSLMGGIWIFFVCFTLYKRGTCLLLLTKKKKKLVYYLSVH